ncbi:MAG TPA: type VI secretion system baseplate subunit TssK [Terracidiphilus sp.]|nr:type VI secretion system baseplate subunit TssK [Terracidiphilus sp.]
MKFLSRVVWSEGMHLGPHHFQTQSRYFEDTLWFLSSNLRQEPWGFLHFSLDTEAMRNGLAILSFASGILPDGLIFDLPDCDSVPDPAHLSSLFSSTDSEIILYLAIPPRQDQGLDCDLGGGASARYDAVQRNLRDDSVGQGENSVSFARKNLVLLSQAQVSDHTVSFPIARVLRDGTGGFTSDPAFIPPCLRISASESLVLLLHRLAQAIDEKIASTRSIRLGSGRFELGTSALDVANYWFLHALCSALPALRHHLQDRRSHPEEVYRDLARLAGALSTFALESTQVEIPPYRHLDLTSTFRELDALIRRYLEIVAPSNSITLQFRKADNYIYAAEVKDERCLRRSRWILGIRSSLTDSVLLRQTPKLIKVCSAEGVAKLVQRALPGLELMHLPVPPAALHAQADMHYFSISLSGACWQHILQTKQVGVYLPGDLGDATFDLTIIMEASA